MMYKTLILFDVSNKHSTLPRAVLLSCFHAMTASVIYQPFPKVLGLVARIPHLN